MFIFPFVSQIQTLLLPLLPLLPLLLHLSTSSSLLCYCCSFFSVITQRQLRGKQGRETFLTGANAKATERYWRYVFEYVPDQHIAPMDMKPLLNVRETHLDIVLTPPGAKYQLGGVPPANKHENNYEEEQEERKERKEQEARPEEGSASAGGSSSGGRSPEGAKKMKMNNKNNKNKNNKAFAQAARDIPPSAQVSMISSLPDLMPGSGEQLLLKATCRADGRFWSSVRSQLRIYESDHTMTHDVDANDEFLVTQAEEIIRKRTTKTIHMNQIVGHLRNDEVQVMCAIGMESSMNEMRSAKDMLDVIQEVETKQWTSDSIFDIPVDTEFIRKYVAAEKWRFQKRVHEVMEHVESIWLSTTMKEAEDKEKKRKRTPSGSVVKQRRSSGGSMRERTEDLFTYPSDVDAMPMRRGRVLRQGMLTTMIDVASEEYTRLSLKTNDVLKPTSTAFKACHEACLEILHTRVDILRSASVFLETTSVKYWCALLHDVHVLYRTGVAQSVLNYVLQDSGQRERLCLKNLPSSIPTFGWGWENAESIPIVNEELRASVIFARTEVSNKRKFKIFFFFDFSQLIFFLNFFFFPFFHFSIFPFSPQISESPEGSVLNNMLLVDLIALWERYDGLCLVDLPTNDLEAQAMEWSPLDWSKFEKKQNKKMEETKRIMTREWYPKAQQILLDAAEEGIFDETPLDVLSHFLEACASLLSRQLWSVILNSAQKYHDFFARYTKCEADVRRDNRSTIEHARSVQRCGILIHMTKHQDDICYAGDQNERLGAMESNIVNLFNKVVEFLVVPSSSRSLLVETAEEDDKNKHSSTGTGDGSGNGNGSGNGSKFDFGVARPGGASPGGGGGEGGEKQPGSPPGSSDSVSPAPSPLPFQAARQIMFPRPTYFLMQTKRLPDGMIPHSKTLIGETGTRNHIDVNLMRKNLERIVDVNCEEARRMLSVYESISTTLISPKERKDVEIMGKQGFGENGAPPTLQEFKNCVEKYLIVAKKIQKEYLASIPCGCFMIQCEQLNTALCEAACLLSKKLLRTLAENTMLRNMKVHKRFEMIRAQTERVPATSEELAELELYFENTLARGGEVDQLKRGGLDLITQTKFLVDSSKDTATGGCGFMMSESYLRPTGHTLDWLRRTDGLILSGKCVFFSFFFF